MIPRLIIVIPCYNEQEVLPITAPQFLAKINQLAAEGLISGDSRVMFVNDGSKDDTWNIIQQLADQDEHYIGIAQSRNRGHQNAVLAGLMEAKDMCDITISIDCDGQDDINAMDEMVKAYLEGCEIVYGVRSKRDTDTFFKRFTAESFYKLLNSMGAEVVYNHADYRLISSRALQELAKFKEVNIFLRGMVPLVGFKSTSVYYERSEPRGGKVPLSAQQNARSGVRRNNQSLDKAHQNDNRHGSFRGIHQLHRDNLGGGGGYPRKNRNGVGFHNMHYLLPKRSSAHLGGSYRRIHRENLHGSKATSAVHYQRTHMGASRQRRYQLAVHDVRIHKAKKGGFSQKPSFFIELWLYD